MPSTRIRHNTESCSVAGSGAILHATLIMIFASLTPAAAGAPVQPVSAASTVTQGISQKTTALVQSADRYLRSATGAEDLSKAIELYRQAGELGNKKAMLKYGEVLALGLGGQERVSAGWEIIDYLAQTGDGNALMLLGDFYGRGLAGASKKHLAIDAYQRGAKLGRTLALVKLGEIYRDGVIVKADGNLAKSYFQEAIDGGRTAALVPLGQGLAEGKFGRRAPRSDGVKILNDAVDRGISEAVLPLSDCYLRGHGVAKNPRRAISILQSALEGGNVEAGRRLVSIYRDGRGGAIARDLIAAESYLSRIDGRLDPATAKFERLLLLASSARERSGFAAVEKKFSEIALADRGNAIRKLRSVNPNAYIYLVQSRLRAMGQYKNKLSGRLTAPTVRAIHAYCSTREVREICKRGPMSGEVTEIVASAFLASAVASKLPSERPPGVSSKLSQAPTQRLTKRNAINVARSSTISRGVEAAMPHSPAVKKRRQCAILFGGSVSQICTFK